VVADVENWSAPRVTAALAGAVHDRQGAACTEHNTARMINKGVFEQSCERTAAQNQLRT
jgi:hypothetical protein